MPTSTSTDTERSGGRQSSGRVGSAVVSFVRRDRGIVLTIVVFLILIASMVGYNVVTTANQRDTALIVNITARQRTLVERYIKDVLLKLQGMQADPNESKDVLVKTADALLEGGEVSAPQGSTDATVTISGIHEPIVRRQLEHARDLIGQLTTIGDRVLANGAASSGYSGDVDQMRLLAAQLSSVTGDAAGGVTRNARDALTRLVRVELLLGLLSAAAAVAMGLLLRRAGARQSARFRSLVHNAADLITVIDPRGRVRYQSPSSAPVLGLPPSEIVGTPFISLVHPDQRAAILSLVAGESIEPGETAPVRFSLWTRSGDWRSMEGTITDLTRDRSVAGLVVNVHDVTERDQAAIELAEARDNAMEASRMKSQFLASMSHEIRTPMNAVIGLSELLLETDLSNEQREYAQGVQRAGDGLLAIIDGILDFSKVEAGRVQLEKVRFDLSELVDEVAGLLGDVANGKNIELLAHYSSDLPTVVRADPTRLRQVLVNLTSNAVKFTQVGEVVIDARADAPFEIVDGATVLRVRFEVRDTGIGMTEVAKQHIFDPFSQADASTTRRYGGTGLGLAIVKQLVELMGGEVGVESKPGVGSTFWFAVPLEVVADVPSDPTVRTLSGLNALVVDDNATNRLILTEQLRSWGIQAEEAADGPTAIVRARYKAVRGAAFDVVVIDLNMPEMDGLDVARVLRDDPTTAEAKLFMLSSSGRVRADLAAEVGLSGSLAKPVRKSDLYNCLIEGVAAPVGGPAASAAPPAAGATRVADSSAGLGDELRRSRVLLVEDNATNRLVASRMIEKLGYAVEIAEHGREAVDAVAGVLMSTVAPRYAAIFMDCQMPVMDGYEATRAIRELEGDRRHTPIIAMTAAAMAGDREACLEAGMDDYMAKPIRPEVVRQALERWAPGTIDGNGDDPQHAADATAGVIDQSRIELLEQLDRDGGDLLSEVLHQYISDATSRMASLRVAVDDGDLGAAAETAHAMRGASANVGASMMATLCGRIEEFAKRGDASGCAALLGVADDEFERVRIALTATLLRTQGGTAS
jgi:two-component system, sensor histidine kinase and response regulator